MEKRITEASKFLSFVLRHQPEAIGLRLEAEGWARRGNDESIGRGRYTLI